jgi:hypothetical protein
VGSKWSPGGKLFREVWSCDSDLAGAFSDIRRPSRRLLLLSSKKDVFLSFVPTFDPSVLTRYLSLAPDQTPISARMEPPSARSSSPFNRSDTVVILSELHCLVQSPQ